GPLKLFSTDVTGIFFSHPFIIDTIQRLGTGSKNSNNCSIFGTVSVELRTFLGPISEFIYDNRMHTDTQKPVRYLYTLPRFQN
ncbi:hypothetical protein, partial [Methylomonas koyamae]|uniref:hypothetical protein n=1 Tax=Methylomonas koyamae TaxID=702114 RepID=UPI00210FD030